MPVQVPFFGITTCRSSNEKLRYAPLLRSVHCLGPTRRRMWAMTAGYRRTVAAATTKKGTVRKLWWTAQLKQARTLLVLRAIPLVKVVQEWCLRFFVIAQEGIEGSNRPVFIKFWWVEGGGRRADASTNLEWSSAFSNRPSACKYLVHISPKSRTGYFSLQGFTIRSRTVSFPGHLTC